MLLFKDAKGILPFYDARPTWECATICSDKTPGFVIKGIAAAFVQNSNSGTPINPSIITITEKGETCTYSYFAPQSLGLDGIYSIQLFFGVDRKPYFSDLFEISTCKQPYKIKASLDCDNITLGPASQMLEMGFDIAAVTTVEPEIISEININNGFGQPIDESFKQRDIQTIDMWMTPGLKQTLGLLRMYDNVTLCCPNGDELEIDPSSLKITYSQSLDKFGTGTLSFSCKDSWICKSSCGCDDIPEENEDDCNTDPNDPACEACELSIDVNDDILTANIVNAPPGTPLITWTNNGSYVTSANSIDTQGIKGNYCLTVKFPDCPEKTICHTVLDPCENFDVDLACSGLKIDGVINGIPTGETATISICDSNGVEVGTSFPTVVPQAGTYTIKVETESCKEIFLKTLSEEETCDHEVSITKENGVLTGVISNCPDGAVIGGFWTSLNEDGSNPIVSNSLTYSPTQTGCFTFHGVCDGCEKVATIFCVIDPDCLDIRIKNWDDMPAQNVTVEPIINVNPDITINETIQIEPEFNINNELIIGPDQCLGIEIKNPCLLVEIKENNDCKTAFEWVCAMGCKLRVDCPGYAVTWVDDNGTTTGAEYEPTSDVTGTVTITKDGCPDLSLPYDFKILTTEITIT